MNNRQLYIIGKYHELKRSGASHREALDIARAYAVKIYRCSKEA